MHIAQAQLHIAPRDDNEIQGLSMTKFIFLTQSGAHLHSKVFFSRVLPPILRGLSYFCGRGNIYGGVALRRVILSRIFRKCSENHDH